jgi:hypothetical protein
MNWSFLTKALSKGNLSQKKFLWALLAAAVALSVYALVIVPLVEAKKKADLEIDLNYRLLQKFAEVLRIRKTVE